MFIFILLAALSSGFDVNLHSLYSVFFFISVYFILSVLSNPKCLSGRFCSTLLISMC